MRQPLRQWVLKITEYADRLADDLEVRVRVRVRVGVRVRVRVSGLPTISRPAAS